MLVGRVYLNGKTHGITPVVTSSYKQIAHYERGSLGQWALADVAVHAHDKVSVDVCTENKVPVCSFAITIRAKKKRRLNEAYTLTARKGSITLYQLSETEFRLTGISLYWNVIDTRLDNLFRLMWIEHILGIRENEIIDARRSISQRSQNATVQKQIRADLIYKKRELAQLRVRHASLYTEVHQQPVSALITPNVEQIDEDWTDAEWQDARSQFDYDEFIRDSNRPGF